MKDRIQGWSSIVLGAAVVILVGWLTMEQMGHAKIRRESADGGAGMGATEDAGAGVSAVATDGGSSGTSTGQPGAATTLGAIDTDGGFGLGSLSGLLGDGGAMPTGAPRAVRLGVVLVQFAGAEGASSSARAKPAALEHAKTLAEQAHADWKAAVKAGDSGSSEDIGRIPRGVLDARTEVAVFSLGKDEISEPLETPRGYWIVKRVE